MRPNAFARAVAAIALLGAFTAPGAARAHSGDASDTAYLVGNGTYAPGLPATGCANQARMEYTATLVVVGDDTGVYNMGFTGQSDVCETLVEGSGVGNYTGGVVGTARYHRHGPASEWGGRFSINGEWHDIVVAQCQHFWTSYNPVTSYTVVCQFALTS